MTDLGTFIAIEAALGKRLAWWITSSDHFLECRWHEDGKPPFGMHSYTTRNGVVHHYLGVVIAPEPDWTTELRRLSA